MVMAFLRTFLVFLTFLNTYMYVRINCLVQFVSKYLYLIYFFKIDWLFLKSDHQTCPQPDSMISKWVIKVDRKVLKLSTLLDAILEFSSWFTYLARNIWWMGCEKTFGKIIILVFQSYNFNILWSCVKTQTRTRQKDSHKIDFASHTDMGRLPAIF